MIVNDCLNMEYGIKHAFHLLDNSRSLRYILLYNTLIDSCHWLVSRGINYLSHLIENVPLHGWHNLTCILVSIRIFARVLHTRLDRRYKMYLQLPWTYAYILNVKNDKNPFRSHTGMSYKTNIFFSSFVQWEEYFHSVKDEIFLPLHEWNIMGCISTWTLPWLRGYIDRGWHDGSTRG